MLKKQEVFIAFFIALLLALVCYHTISDSITKFHGITFSNQSYINWTKLEFNDSSWGDGGQILYRDNISGDLYIRQFFETEDSSALVNFFGHDQIKEVYLNGRLLFNETCSACFYRREINLPLEPLVKGKNLLSIKLKGLNGVYWLKTMETKGDLTLILIAISMLFFIYMLRKNNLDSFFYSIIFFILVSLGFLYPIYQNFWNIGLGDWDLAITSHLKLYKVVAKYHQFPLWDPYLCGGGSNFGDSQNPILSPYFLSILLLGPIAGIKINLLLHSIIGMFGMYLLSRHFKLYGISAYLPPIVLMLSGVLSLHISEGHATWMFIAYTPWVFLLYLKGKENIIFTILSSLSCALIFFSGAVHIFTYTLILIVLYAFFDIIVNHDKKTIPSNVLKLGIFIIIIILISAVKLIPLIEHQSINPYLQKDVNSMTIDIFYNALLNRAQYKDMYFPGQVWGWWEYGAYIGWIPLLLALLAVFSKERIILLLTILSLLALSLSGLYGIDLWALLQNLPFLNSMHVPSRLVIMVVFLLSFFAGSTMLKIEEKRKYVSLILLFFILFDLTNSNSRILATASFIPNPYENLNESDFIQTYATKPVNYFFTSTYMLPEVMQNKGIVNCYSRGHIPPRVYAIQDENYTGEVFIASQSGNARIIKFTPNHIQVAVDINASDYVVLNQNYYPGWRSTAGTVESYNGMISVRVSPEIKQFEFYFLPYSVVLGALITVISFLIVIALILKLRHSLKSSQ